MAKVNNNLDSLFPSLEASHKEENDVDYDFFDFERLTLGDIGDGEHYQGKPVLSDVSSVTFDEDGQEITKYRCQLWLVDYEAQEFLQINLNLKNSTDVQVNVHYKSQLYKLVGGINEQLSPGWTQANNYIDRVDLSEIRDYVNKLKSMTIRAREVHGTFDYYTYAVKEIQ